MTRNVTIGTDLYLFPKFGDNFSGQVDFVRTADDLGFHHIRLLDHIVGIDAAKHGGIAQTPYTAESCIRECFTLMAYLAAVTKNIRLVAGVLALPMRQTVLVAKQAAEVDIYSGGRVTLGVGIGYNPVEFQCVGARFDDRARRFEEQVAVLRRLWTQDNVTFNGQWHSITDASLAPRPIQQPIPLWFGVGRTIKPISPDVVLKRIGRLADGWMPMIAPDDQGRKAVQTVRDAAAESGRNPDDVKLEMLLYPDGKSRDELAGEIEALTAFGADQINVCFVADSASEATEVMKRFREDMDDYF